MSILGSREVVTICVSVKRVSRYNNPHISCSEELDVSDRYSLYLPFATNMYLGTRTR